MPAKGHRKNFIEELQSLDEGKKTRVLVVTTVVVMIVVVYFWLAYFNNIIASTMPAQPIADQSAGADSAAPAVADESGSGSWTAAIYQGFRGVVSGFENIFRAPRQIDIEPSAQQ